MSKNANICAVRTIDLPVAEGVGLVPIERFPLWAPEVWAGPRQVLETDPSFKQLIPYVLVTKGNTVLGYTRGKAGGEDRLHDLVSIGVGGHVDTMFAAYNKDGEIDFQDTVIRAAQRELEEEIGFAPSRTDIELLGVILSDANPTDHVHLGLVLRWDATKFIESGCKFVFEDTIEAPRFMTRAELHDEGVELESWSQITLALL